MTTQFRSVPQSEPDSHAENGEALSHNALQPSQRATPAKRRSLMRKYEVASLAPDGSVRYSQHIAPATAEFESAFSAFARGTMITTPQGPCAIEDLEPGMEVCCGDSVQKVTWVGMMMMVPTAPIDDPVRLRLTRIMADTFGLSRPMPDLVLGYGARLLRMPAELREMAVHTDILMPARAFVDGMSVIEITPQTPVALYHLCLERHGVIRAGGLEVESYHPGATLLRDMSPSIRALFLSLFPQIAQPEDFGALAFPRAGRATLASLDIG